MSQITKNGRLLALELGLSQFGNDAATCSLIMRHARTLQNLAEAECNGPGDWVDRIPYPEAGRIHARHEAWIAKRQEQVSKRVRELVAELPGITGCHVDGDPRGTIVKLLRADGRYNTWGGDESGWAVPLDQ